MLPALCAAGFMLWSELESGFDPLAPRAYVITPVGFNAITVTWSYFNGGVNLNGTIPVTGATGTFSVSSFTFFWRSANIIAGLPYGVGTFQGKLEQQQRSVYRSGLVDFGDSQPDCGCPNQTVHGLSTSFKGVDQD